MKNISPKTGLESFNAGPFFEELSGDESFYTKKFFRGLSICVFGKSVAYLSDRPGDRDFRGQKYDIDVWNGCLIPTDREHHSKLLKSIKGSVVHPVIEKWLYLPCASEHFEDSMTRIVEMIRRKDALIGIEPELKASRAKGKIKRPTSKKDAKPKSKPKKAKSK